MSSILIVLTDDPDERLLAAAKRYVTGTDLEVVLCRVVNEQRYRDDLQRKAGAGAHDDVQDIDSLEEAVRTEALEIAEAAFGDDVSYTAVGLVGTIPDDVLRVADEWGSEHVFVTGRRRSPTGKVLFGDNAQRLILNFDGPVTITTRSG